MAMRRSASEPISQSASAIMSAAKATGSAWKLPPDSASSVSAKISGLSVTPLASIAERRGGLAQQVEHGAHHLRLAAQAIGVLHALVADADARRGWRCRPSARAAPRRSRSGRDGRASAWMRGSNGVSEPRAASVDSAPVTSAALEQRLGLEQAGQRVGGGELRAVEQRQPFLRRRARAARARPAASASAAGMRGRRRRRPRRRRSSPPPYAPAARDRPRRRPSLAPARPASRPRASIASSSAQRLRPHARGALREAGELQRHHQPRDRRPASARRRRRRATARCCAAASRDRRRRCARSPACRSRC